MFSCKKRKSKRDINYTSSITGVDYTNINPPVYKEILYLTFLPILGLLIAVSTFLIRCVLLIYTGVVNSIYLLIHFVISFFYKKKQLKRCNSGFLNNQNGNNKITLVLDLDSTLIYSSTNKLDYAKNYAIIGNLYYVYKRPHLDSFLTTMSQFCELIIYTASTKDYADKIIDYIDKNKLIQKRYYRHDCVAMKNYYLKDVSKFHNEGRILIIDDSPTCHLNYKDNIIHIKSWYGNDERDDSLLKIKNITKNYWNCGGFDIREIIYSSINNDV